MTLACSGERAFCTNALVVVVDRHRKLLFSTILANDILVQKRLDLLRVWKINALGLGCYGVAELLFNDFVTKFDALVTNVDRRSSD